MTVRGVLFEGGLKGGDNRNFTLVYVGPVGVTSIRYILIPIALVSVERRGDCSKLKQ